ncbi:MAG TPA: putative LPS assembly protein LptD [Bacteroidales bacterium]|nr:putative LPS assembly protein LptD [Bacteroidales bacterium]
MLVLINVINAQNVKDSLSITVEDTKKDSIKVGVKKNNFKLEAPVNYSAEDSLVMDLNLKKAYLYNKSNIQYQDIELKSHFIEIDMSQNEAFAKGSIDSLGKEIDKPQFKDGSDNFEAKTLRYNFNSKKGIITDVTTEQSGGYLHGSKTKKFEDNHVCLTNAHYTTCNLEHPHFYITLSKAKVIPNDKIVSGPAYLVIEDIPIPLGIPFGFFPNKKGNKSGILIPEYGEEEQRGFFLRNGGYYIAINDYMDLSIIGEGYTKGSWGASLLSNYKKRYKYNGNFNISYSNIIVSEKGLPNYQNNKAYYLRWNHSQDSKAHPYHNFSANVNIGSQTYNRFNMYSYQNRLRSEMQSSVSYRQQWPNSPFNLSANLRHSQNFSDSTITLSLPDIYFSMSRKTLFKKIGISYSSNLQNSIHTKEDKLLTDNTLHQMRNGIKHSVPVSANFKILKYVNLNPSLTYTERWYVSKINKEWIPTQIIGNDTIAEYLKTDTIQGFSRAGDWAFSLPFSTQLYGFYLPRNPTKRFKGLRHLMTPTVSFSYRPDYTNLYYKTTQKDTYGNTETYSIFQNGIFGTPPSGKYGMVNFSLNNQFEMKMKEKNDTANKVNKITLLDQLSINTSYNLAIDSLNWQPVQLQARTTLFKILNLYANATYNLYSFDSLGRFINTFEYQRTKKLANLIQANISSSFSINSDGFTKNKNNITTEVARQAAVAAGLPDDYMNNYVDFKIPWTLQITYTLSQSNYFNVSSQKLEPRTIQTLSFSGDLSLTQKWKISFSSGYDFISHKFTYTNLNIYRDLHCWEMRLSWIPFGTYRSYSFQINVKSSILQDLKLARKRPFLDNF